MSKSLLTAPGQFLSTMAEFTAITKHGSLDLYHWLFNVNRRKIIQLAKRWFPEEYASLQESDISLMANFLDSEFISNTVSLALGPEGCEDFPSESEFIRKHPYGFAKSTEGSVASRESLSTFQVGSLPSNGQRWFFINGIFTPTELARANALALHDLFGQNIQVVYNPTRGLIADLTESAMQKFTNVNTEVVAKAFVEIGNALLDDNNDKVVITAHSQGTIIAGDVLDLIYCSVGEQYFDRTNMNPEELAEFIKISHDLVKSSEVFRVVKALRDQQDLVCKKLELYLFANAASRVCYLDDTLPLPHIESFANTHDVVARLGVLAKDCFHRNDAIRIHGPLFVRNCYGHLLNAHYLPGIKDSLYQPLSPFDGDCIGPSIHNEVLGNPCYNNPKYRAYPTPVSRLISQYKVKPAPNWHPSLAEIA